MSNVIDTGDETVDYMGQINLSGNVIPPNWYKSILRENGKPYLLAIIILSEICYWYRPKEIRDEHTGYVVRYSKRFREDYLQKSYQQLADQFGETKRSVKAAMDCLEEIGVITRIWRNKTFSNGGSMTNILFIALNVDKLLELTYEKPDVQTEEEQKEEKYEEHETADAEMGTEKTSENPVNKHVTKKRNMNLQNFVGHPTKFCKIIPQNSVGCPTKKRRINTKNTIETTYRDYNPIYQEPTDERPRDGTDLPGDEMDRIAIIQDIVKENIEYDILRERYEGTERKRFDELFMLICDVLYKTRGTVRIGGEDMPYQVVQSVFYKLNSEHIVYVMDSMNETECKIKNIRAYLITSLYRAQQTMYNYDSQEYNYSRLEQIKREYDPDLVGRTRSGKT